MTTKTEKKAEPPKKIEKTTDQYSCQIVLEKTTQEKANDKKLPSDAFNVTYMVEGKGFKGQELKVNVNQEELNKLIKVYKKMNKYRRSPLFAVKSIWMWFVLKK